MTRTQIYRTLVRCSEGGCKGCLLEHADNCQQLLARKAAAVIRADNELIGVSNAQEISLDV